MDKRYLYAMILICISVFVILNLTGCGKTKYSVDYGNSKDVFRGAKDSYAAGKMVTLLFPEEFIGTDTDYSFHVEGADADVTWTNKGYQISFVMPEHDVKVSYDAVNSMAYTIPMDANTFIPIESGSDDEVYMECVSLVDSILTVRLINHSSKDCWYGYDYELLKQNDNGEFESLECEEFCWIELALELPSEGSAEMTCDLSYYGTLEPGRYQLRKSGMTAEFELIS